MASIPVTYKATNMQLADYSRFFEIEEGLDELAEYRGTDLPLPGAPGQYEGVRVADRRVIVLLGWLKGTSLSNYRALKKALDILCDPTAPGDLVATLEDGTTATIRARALAIVPVTPPRGAFRGFRIVMLSIAPDWTVV